MSLFLLSSPRRGGGGDGGDSQVYFERSKIPCGHRWHRWTYFFNFKFMHTFAKCDLRQLTIYILINFIFLFVLSCLSWCHRNSFIVTHSSSASSGDTVRLPCQVDNLGKSRTSRALNTLSCEHQLFSLLLRFQRNGCLHFLSVLYQYIIRKRTCIIPTPSVPQAVL